MLSLLCKRSIKVSNLRKTCCRGFWSNNQTMANPIILDSNPKDSPKAIVVFLHGLGDTGQGWSDIFKYQLPGLKNDKVKYLFPTAEQLPVTLNGGFKMHSWYDLHGLKTDIDQYLPEDTEGIEKASQKLTDLVDQELELYPNLTTKNVILSGFSQGGSVALYTAFNRSNIDKDNLYGGVIGLSTYLPLRDSFLANDHQIIKNMKDTKVFIGHGDIDEVVPHQFGKAAFELVANFNPEIESRFETYKYLGHSCNQEEMDHVKEFIEKFVS